MWVVSVGGCVDEQKVAEEFYALCNQLQVACCNDIPNYTMSHIRRYLSNGRCETANKKCWFVACRATDVSPFERDAPCVVLGYLERRHVTAVQTRGVLIGAWKQVRIRICFELQ